uniref:Uncharacterized protein n=1 Tax=Strongyloides stercoralis TaxID=6248 RepID=A0A0K0ELS7_STRER
MPISADNTTIIISTTPVIYVISNLKTYGPIILLIIILFIFIIASIIGNKKMQQQNTLFENSHYDEKKDIDKKNSTIEGIVVTNGETGASRII